MLFSFSWSARVLSLDGFSLSTVMISNLLVQKTISIDIEWEVNLLLHLALFFLAIDLVCPLLPFRRNLITVITVMVIPSMGIISLRWIIHILMVPFVQIVCLMWIIHILVLPSPRSIIVSVRIIRFVGETSIGMNGQSPILMVGMVPGGMVPWVLYYTG